MNSIKPFFSAGAKRMEMGVQESRKQGVQSEAR